jgi:hypothetical protein
VIGDTGWYKSSFSGSGQAACVEVRIVRAARVGLRDSKDPTGKPLWVGRLAWSPFLAMVTRS